MPAGSPHSAIATARPSASVKRCSRCSGTSRSDRVITSRPSSVLPTAWSRWLRMLRPGVVAHVRRHGVRPGQGAIRCTSIAEAPTGRDRRLDRATCGRQELRCAGHPAVSHRPSGDQWSSPWIGVGQVPTRRGRTTVVTDHPDRVQLLSRDVGQRTAIGRPRREVKPTALLRGDEALHTLQVDDLEERPIQRLLIVSRIHAASIGDLGRVGRPDDRVGERSLVSRRRERRLSVEALFARAVRMDDRNRMDGRQSRRQLREGDPSSVRGPGR